MAKSQIVYYVNGVAQTFWTRVVPTKTFRAAWTAAAVVLLDGVTTKLVVTSPGVVLGAAALAALASLLRDSVAKSELSSNAANPDISTVKAYVEIKPDGPSMAHTLGNVFLGGLVVAAICATLASCDRNVALQGPDWGIFGNQNGDTTATIPLELAPPRKTMWPLLQNEK